MIPPLNSFLSSRAVCLHNLNELDDAQQDPIALQKLLNPEKVSDLISRIKYEMKTNDRSLLLEFI